MERPNGAVYGESLSSAHLRYMDPRSHWRKSKSQPPKLSCCGLKLLIDVRQTAQFTRVITNLFRTPDRCYRTWLAQELICYLIPLLIAPSQPGTISRRLPKANNHISIYCFAHICSPGVQTTASLSCIPSRLGAICYQRCMRFSLLSCGWITVANAALKYRMSLEIPEYLPDPISECIVVIPVTPTEDEACVFHSQSS